jgi:hypothetical protein
VDFLLGREAPFFFRALMLLINEFLTPNLFLPPRLDADFLDRDLPEADFFGAEFLAGLFVADLRDEDFRGADFFVADFRGADFFVADFLDVDLSAPFFGADFFAGLPAFFGRPGNFVAALAIRIFTDDPQFQYHNKCLNECKHGCKRY